MGREGKEERRSWRKTMRQIGITMRSCIKKNIFYKKTIILVLCNNSSVAQRVNKTVVLRRATVNDAQQIRNCNCRNLPENYELDFIKKQILAWPYYSHVVEVDKNIAGYVLGKVDRVHVRRNNSLREYLYAQPVIGHVGHITSIAIEEPFRRSGIAAALVRITHERMCELPNLRSINLLCRVSNEAAIQHYTKLHGYLCKHRLPAYYSDGEDGWFMEWQNPSIDK